MKIEKSLFLGLTLIGIFYNPLALIPTAMVFIYILANEHSLNKKNEQKIIKIIEEEIAKITTSLENKESDIQKVKDSIIGLKLERGITAKMVRNG
jgi:hypothetical protein